MCCRLHMRVFDMVQARASGPFPNVTQNVTIYHVSTNAFVDSPSTNIYAPQLQSWRKHSKHGVFAWRSPLYAPRFLGEGEKHCWVQESWLTASLVDVEELDWVVAVLGCVCVRNYDLVSIECESHRMLLWRGSFKEFNEVWSSKASVQRRTRDSAQAQGDTSN